MKTLAIILALLAGSPVVAGPSAPTSRPAKATPQAELTPIGWLRAYNTAMLDGDKDALLTRTHATGEEAKKLAEAMSAHDALVGKLLKLAKTKLDDKSSHLIGLTLGDISNEDIANATVIVDGDHATVSAGGGFGDTNLVLHNGQWKLDYDTAFAQQRRIGLSVDERLKSLKIKTDAAQTVLTGLESGNVKTVDDALFILRRELSE